MNIKFNQLVKNITKAVRLECQEVGIDQGAIAIAIEGVGGFVKIDEGFTIRVLPVVPGKDTFYREYGEVTGDCAAVALQKVFTTKHAIAYHGEHQPPNMDREYHTSGAIPKNMIIDGLTHWKGGIGVPIGCFIGGSCGHQGALCATIYVAVSGGKEDDDEKAAWAALEPIRKWCERQIHNDHPLMVAGKFYD